MNISDAGLALIKSHEGCMLQSYPDPGTGADPWTIGYGHTGAEVVPGLIWTQEQCDAQLQADMVSRERTVSRFVLAPITQNSFDALCSFVYNVGQGAFVGSTMLKKINAHDYAGAADQFQFWNKSGGRVMPGLIARRADEAKLFLS
jgi:lysozyme